MGRHYTSCLHDAVVHEREELPRVAQRHVCVMLAILAAPLETGSVQRGLVLALHPSSRSVTQLWETVWHALQFDSMRAASYLVHLTVAYVLALPVAWDRERSTVSLGLRTIPLVAVASCAFMLLGLELAAASADARSRIVQGIITGIGFLGGGAILKQGNSIHGTSTAASIWTTAALGVAVALNRYEVAVLLSVVSFATLRWLKRFKPTDEGHCEAEGGSSHDTVIEP